MLVEPSDPAPFHTCESSIQFPPPVRIRVDRTRAAVHHSLRIRLSSPCALSASGVASLRVAFAFPAASFVRFRCVFTLFCPRPHCAPSHVLSHRARVLPSVQNHLRSHGLRQRREPACTRILHYTSIPLCCRCHVTHTNRSRALAASSLVAQDTTHPPNTLISPHVCNQSKD